MLIAVRTNVLVKEAMRLCCEILREHVDAGSDALIEHQGTQTLTRSRCPKRILRYFDRAAAVAIAAGERLVSKRLVLAHADLVYRPAGRPMPRHDDVTTTPNRLVSCVLPLHTMDPELGGHSVIETPTCDHAYDHRAGRMIVYPSEYEHYVTTPGEDRVAMLLWLRESPTKEKGCLPSKLKGEGPPYLNHRAKGG